ncbi:AAA family ATPase [Mesonia maritima]|uniref:ATPase n=1 Tax=Mesonia maritima TaxID=1793873 RepID=A0ABU1K2A4_9FLAO|nr:AAA family ATPase [Mesonia maritima]MDR6299734.1 putative ATPase [Mesonia maritima]
MNLSISFADKLDLPSEFNSTEYILNESPFIPDQKEENNYHSLYLRDISSINFFIGANNSGKSRFLRGIFKIDKSRIEVFKNDDSLTLQFKKIKESLEYISQNQDRYLQKPFQKINELIVLVGINKKVDILNFTSQKFDYSEINNRLNVIELQFNSTKRYFKEKTKVEMKNLIDRLKIFFTDVFINENLKQNNKIYIPVLRYANSNDSLRSETYQQILKENYEIEDNVFTGLSLYSDIRRLQGSIKSSRKKKKEFERFLSQNFFNQKSVEITASSENSNEIYFDIDDEERKLFNLGDGLQSIILLMFPIYTANENTWIFIDEPENHLHPGFQKIFLRTLLQDEYLKSKNLQFFITTHSNHFLDDSIRNDSISIFQFEKNEDQTISIDYLKKPSKNTLDILGVSNASVLISNSSIWVEGPTDRYYLSYFLDKYSQSKKTTKLLEDIDFAFFEYGGNLIAHYLFDEKFKDDDDEVVRNEINSFALSNHIYLLADNDNASGRTKKGKRRKELEKLSKENDHFKYQNTEVVEIENLLPSKVILDFAKELIGEGEIEKIKHIKIERDNYLDIRLGDFYKELFKKYSIQQKYQKKFRAESGTLKAEYKIKLCNFIIKNDYSYSSLIEENKILDTIVSELYSFVIAQK